MIQTYLELLQRARYNTILNINTKHRIYIDGFSQALGHPVNCLQQLFNFCLQFKRDSFKGLDF